MLYLREEISQGQEEEEEYRLENSFIPDGPK